LISTPHTFIGHPSWLDARSVAQNIMVNLGIAAEARHYKPALKLGVRRKVITCSW
jgi:hypothetical protein